MRWVAKAAMQKALSALPHAETANYLFQRHVTRSLPAGPAAFAQKLARAEDHLTAFTEHGPGRPLAAARFYEFGAGWDLAIQLAYWTLGVDRQTIVDLRPNLRLELVNATLCRIRALDRDARDPGPDPVRSPAELEARFGITYLAPRDARSSGLETGSVDFVSSTNTLEHVPHGDLVPLLRECNRLLAPDGVVSFRIDLRDHFAYFDRSLTFQHFLRYSDRTWRLVNSSLFFQNRLRRPDYLDAFAESGFEIVAEKAHRPHPDKLAGLELDERFKAYSLADASVESLALVARPSPDAS